MNGDDWSRRPPGSAAPRRASVWPFVVVLIVALLLSPYPWQWLGLAGSAPAQPRAVVPRGDLADFEKTTAAIFREASPSVVYINTRQQVANRWSRRVYEVEAGTGSGFVWDDRGHVVTNYHVIEEASSAQVVFHDQRAFDATLVGVSPDHDLAVLRVRAEKDALVPILIGTSADLIVGQAVFAIGNPFGLNQTLTTGVVSAQSRRIAAPTGEIIDDVIQIDASINPGNSGGPLLDSAGRLIGVNTAIYSPTGASAGVGFSVPVDTVNRVVPQLINRGVYEPPRVGIRANDELNERVAAQIGVRGVVVLGVEPGGGAEAAGVRPATGRRDGTLILGDVITSVDGERVASLSELLDRLDTYTIGDVVTLGLRRADREVAVDVTLD